MDDERRQRIGAAAQDSADALVAAYRDNCDGTAAGPQRLGTQQIEYFFDARDESKPFALRAREGGFCG